MTKAISRWLLLLGILVLGCPLVYLSLRHALAEQSAESPNPDLWLRAAELEPSNADNWYRLGRYRELDFEHGDVPLAITYYQRAASLEPMDALFWVDLAATYETAGKMELAEQSYRKAQQDYPISADVAWRYGNFLLRENRVEEAFQQIDHAVSVDPKLTMLAVSRCWRSTQDIDQILNFALPRDAESYWGTIQYFVSVQQPDAAMAVWNRLASFQPTALSLNRAAPLLDLLIDSDRVDNALTVWRQALAAGGTRLTPQSSSLVWDGGFEANLLNIGFAWRYQPIDGVEVGWDEETFHSGQRSLRISFSGSEKMNFAQVWQYVAVQPSTTYRFTSYVRTQAFDTDSGIGFKIYESESHRGLGSTQTVVGTQPWAPLEEVVTTGPQTRLLQLILYRNPSDLLTSKLQGTVWVDDVSLVPASDAAEER